MYKVLLINDCRFESVIMKDALEDLGCSVEISNEFQILSMVRDIKPNIIITNLIMKTINGDSLIEKIKNQYPTIWCILSSCNPIKLENYKTKKVDAVIHTPLNRDEVVHALEGSSKNERAKYNFAFCPYCGQKYDKEFSSYIFCPYCGKKIN